MELQKSTAPKYTVWVVIGFVFYYVIMEITQKVIDRLSERVDEGMYPLLFIDQGHQLSIYS